MNSLLEFYKGKRVFVTGHTGFKGSWMCKVLSMAGAEVTGYSLGIPTKPSLFELARLEGKVKHIEGDIRNLEQLTEVFKETRPEIVIHLAAQPLVRESYNNPVYTYETNIMGTVNVLECIRHTDSVKSVINVTTDKVYYNREWSWGYRESDELNGYDPYSNSKSCSELVTSSYINSFLREKGIAISTCRAGNVIGGGDFADNRIVPDCIRAASNEKEIEVRNPYSIRPYQHVLEPVIAYLMVAMKQYENPSFAGSYNVGPNDDDCWNTGRLVELFCDEWKKKMGKKVIWINKNDGGPHEANFLKLDCSKIKSVFGWQPVWNVETAVEKIIEWTSCYLKNGNIETCMEEQVNSFLNVKD